MGYSRQNPRSRRAGGIPFWAEAALDVCPRGPRRRWVGSPRLALARLTSVSDAKTAFEIQHVYYIRVLAFRYYLRFPCHHVDPGQRVNATIGISGPRAAGSLPAQGGHVCEGKRNYWELWAQRLIFFVRSNVEHFSLRAQSVPNQRLRVVDPGLGPR